MIDRREVNEMARLKAILEGKPSTFEPGPALPGDRHAAAVADTVPADPGVAAMKSILEAFKGAAEDTAATLAHDAVNSREIRRAIATEATDHGAVIGLWEIRVTEEGSRKFYSVGRLGETETIASDLTLYEAAHGLACHLSEGGQINAREVMDLLSAEQHYAQALTDAIHFKRMMARQPDSPRFPIFEDRYGEAQRRAVQARNRVFSLARL